MPSFKRSLDCCLSRVALLALFAASGRAATITKQPENLTVVAGQRAELSVQATSSGKLSYQWRRNGVDLPGATGASYVLPVADRCDADWYEVAVLDGLENVVSQTVRLSVAPTSYPRRVAADSRLRVTTETDLSIHGMVVAVAADGRFYVGGDLSSVTGRRRHGLARFLADGTLDESFVPPEGDLLIRAILPSDDGGVLIGGRFTWSAGATPSMLARLGSDGSLLDPVVVRLDGDCLSLARRPDKSILVGGGFRTVNGQTRRGLCRLNPDLSVDATFAVAFDETGWSVFAISPEADGKVVVGGQFSSIGGVSHPNLARVDSQGRLDSTYESSASHWVRCLARQPDGRLLVGGDFTSLAGRDLRRFARINADGKPDENMRLAVDGSVNAIAVRPNGDFYMVGGFGSIDGKGARRIAFFRENGTRVDDFSASLSSYPTAVAWLPSGDLVVAGNFFQVNDRAASRLAMIDGSGRLKESFVPAVLSVGRAATLVALPGGKLFVGGEFTHVGGVATPVPNIAILNADGSLDPAFQPSGGPEGGVEAAVRQPDGRLVLLGNFSHYGGVPRSRAARIDPNGSLDPSFNAGPLPAEGSYGAIWEPVITRGGRIAFVSMTSSWKGELAHGIVVLGPDGNRDSAFDMGTGFANQGYDIWSLAAQADGKLLVGGNLKSFNGAAVPKVVRLNRDGSRDETFRVGAGPNYTVKGISVAPDGALFIAGDFSFYDTRPSNGIVRLLADGTSDLKFDSHSGQCWGASRILHQEDGRILVYGSFLQMGGLNHTRHLGRLSAGGSPDSTFEMRDEILYERGSPLIIRQDGTLVTVDSTGSLQFLVPATGPTILRQPVGCFTTAGSDIELSVSASGVPTPAYQWFRNGVRLEGKTDSRLAFSDFQLSQVGRYTVEVSNSMGSVLSVEAVVTATLAGPKITVPPQVLTVEVGQGAALEVAHTANGTPSYQWYGGGELILGAVDRRYVIPKVQLEDSRLYSVTISDAYGTATSRPVLLGISIPGKWHGAVVEVGADIAHANGNVYDQMLLSGERAAVRADAGQVMRTSFVDLSDDIVQVEFSGAGTLTITLESATGPARPANYNQAVNYMKGHARIVVAGADETTNLSVFSVGRMTAFDPTGAFDVSKPIGGTNDPARNGNPIFKSGGSYDGHADLASISILSANGKFGGLRTSNASYFATAGLTGIYAPGVTFTGPVFVGDLNASDAAQPVLRLGAASDVRITGGDLTQANGAAVDISGIARLRFTAGQNSHGRALPAQANKAKLTENGVEVTDQVAVNPGR